MKFATLLAATLATASVAAQAGGVVFQTPVTYTEHVIYAAGVTYMAPVTYGPSATVKAAEPVMLERVIVTPSRTYAEREWNLHMASKKANAQLYPVRSERRTETRTRSVLRTLLPLQ